MIYLLYVTSCVVYNLSPFGSDLASDDRMRNPEALKRFNELNILVKSVLVIVGSPLMLVIDVIPRESTLTLKFIARNIVYPFYEFLCNLPQLLWTHCIQPFGMFIKAVAWWVIETCIDLPRLFLVYILKPLGESVTYILKCVYPIAEFFCLNVLKPIGDFVFITIPRYVVWFWNDVLVKAWTITKGVVYQIWLPVKTWVLEKLYNIWCFLCVVYDTVASTWRSVKTAIYEMYEAGRDTMYEMYYTLRETWSYMGTTTTTTMVTETSL